MILFNLWTEIQKITNDFQEWIAKNSSNPILWIGLFLLGLAIFGFVYSALQKEK